MVARAKPLPRDQRVFNRGKQLRRDKDEVKNISVNLMDMDSAIMYYFEQVISPTVVENGETVKVPILYASPERWKSIQVDGYLRDDRDQIIIPAIAYKRTTIEKDDNLPTDKLDANFPHIRYSFQKQFSRANRYTDFSIAGQQNAAPIQEYYNVVFPKYMNLSYDFVVLTTYIEQMNKIVEAITYSENSYWGDPEKMKFRVNIDSFTDASELTDSERIIKTEFSITLHGYLVPESFNNEVTTKKYLTPRRIIIKQETDVPITDVTGRAKAEGESMLSSKSIDATTPTILGNPLIITQGTGVTVSNSGTEFTGVEEVSQQISIGQAVELNSNVTFSSVSASSYYIGDITKNITIDNSGITGDWNVTGSLTVTNEMTVNNNVTVLGKLTARQFFTEFVSASIIYASGSTKFGDTLDDTHNYTGSLLITGSFDINGNIVNDISDDTALTDSSTTTLVTENAVKTYVDNQTNDIQTYLRKQYVKIASSIIIPNTASFSAVTASAPSPLTATSEDDFIFFINSAYMESDAITIQQLGSTFYLMVDTGSIGYDLEEVDEIISYGKFNS